MLTQPQQEERAMRLGSSDAPIVAGVSPYKGPQTLYYQMTGQLPRYDPEETWEQKMGTLVEPIVAELVAEREGIKVRRIGVREHAKYPWMVAHLDYEIVAHSRGPGILEIKRRSHQRFHVLPDEIRLQVAHQLAVTDREWSKVAVLFDWGAPVVFDVDRDRELESNLIELEVQFMDRLARNDPPPFEYNAETATILKQLYPQDSGREVILEDPAAWTHWNALLAARAMLHDVEDAKEREEAWFKDQIREAATLRIPNLGTITWKTAKGSRRFDLDRCKAEHPDLVEKYMTMTAGSRRFLVKEEKKLSDD